jgi:hypothetical protein
LNVQTNPPSASLVITVPVNVQSDPPVGATRTELNATVTPETTLNPDPVSVYVAPTRPWVGFTLIVGVVTENA